MEKINVFGGTGFIGKRFCELYAEEVIINSKNDYNPNRSEEHTSELQSH